MRATRPTHLIIQINPGQTAIPALRHVHTGYRTQAVPVSLSAAPHCHGMSLYMQTGTNVHGTNLQLRDTHTQGGKFSVLSVKTCFEEKRNTEENHDFPPRAVHACCPHMIFLHVQYTPAVRT
jgi:hypothetical protein